jgi:hypothetical protein
MATDLGSVAAAQQTFQTGIDNYGAFAGTQITAFINHVQIGTLMGVSYTVHTEKQGQYTMGSQNVRRFVTGKRGIAGTLVFNTFDRSALLAIFGGSNLNNTPLLSGDPYSAEFNTLSSITGNDSTQASGMVDSTDLFNKIPTQTAGGSNFYNNTAGLTNSIALDLQSAYANAFAVEMDYADMLPPFNVNLAMVDTQGNAAAMSLIGVEIMNEGGGFTVDDLTNQTAYTFVARSMRPLIPVGKNTGGITGGFTLPTVAQPSAF